MICPQGRNGKSMQSGENIHALQRILDFVRIGSIAILLLHFYSVGYQAMQEWHLTFPITDRVIYGLYQQLPVLSGINKPKVVVLILLGISLVGKNKKDEKQQLGPVIYYIVIGILLFFISSLLLLIPAEAKTILMLYIAVTGTGYFSIMAGGNRISRLLWLKYNNDIFNDLNESFPQAEEPVVNEYSLNFPMEYSYKGKKRHGYISFPNIFRGTICAGTPGSGKSFYFFREVLSQLSSKSFTFCLYDLKFPDLTIILYNHILKKASSYPIPPTFYIINFDDLSRSHRCNVLYPENMRELTDAAESSRTLMYALNRQWIKTSGEFFSESAINFVTALFWFLRNYDGGKYCTLPHALELASAEYDDLWPVLSSDPTIDVLISPFLSAYLRKATEQLEGQIGSAKIALARLVSPSLYYILSGSDCTLDINNPEHPKILAFGSNPAKTATYGAVISLYLERMHKLINKKNQRPCALIYDEYSSLTASTDFLIQSARSNLVAVFLGLQDISQLVRDYGKEQAEVISNLCGNIISGQVLGQSAKDLSERIGKINQEKESVSINANDTSLSKSTQLDYAIPPSRISNLSSGTFVGTVADTPQQPIKNKVFHCRIINDPEAIKKEQENYEPIPVIRNIDDNTVMQNYYQIKQDIKKMLAKELTKIRGDPKPGNTDSNKPVKKTTTSM
jgi:hypothetical protein